jgi:hypothetical protein
MSPAFWMAFGLTWLVSYASSLVLAWVLGGIDFETVGAMLLPATLVTCLVTTCGLLVPSVLGCWFMWREGRNLMPAGAQLAAVWGGYRVIIVAVAWLSVAAMNGPAETLLQDLGHMLKLNPLYVGLLVWIVLMLALAGVYIATMYRAMYAARYANR